IGVASGAGPVVALKRRLSIVPCGAPARGPGRAGRLLLFACPLTLPPAPLLAQTHTLPPFAAPAPAPLVQPAAAKKACMTCHQPPARAEKAPLAGDLHARIIRLMNEAERQRGALVKTEALLRDALAEFEKHHATHEKKTKKAPGVEERLERLLREVE